MKPWRQILFGLSALVLAPALYAANPCTTGGAPLMRDGTGAGGTGIQPGYADGTGQGGTGIAPWKHSDGDGSGTGGTGMTVEVEGVITGFASICVNGLELHYRPATPVSIHGKAGSPADLAVGQVVYALAKGQGDQLAVQQVQVRHLLVAQIEKLSPNSLQAQGRAISLSPDTFVPSGLTTGTKIAVSGFVGANGYLMATRLEMMPDNSPDSLTGEVQRNTQGQLTVNGVILNGALLIKLESGNFIRAEGRYEQGRMQVSRFEREERAVPVDRVVIQGLIRNANKSAINIGGQRFLIDPQTRIKQAPPRAGEWVRVDAVREGQAFHAREVDTEVRPNNHLDKSLLRGNDTRHETGARKPESGVHSNGDATRTERTTEQSERSGAAERPTAPEKVERPETPEKIEKPERVERPETPERVEKPERIERPEHPESHS